MPRLVFLSLAALFVTVPATAQHGPRQEFVDQISQLRVGMHVDQLRKVLGEPDDIRTQYDPGGISRTARTKTKEIWCYGTNGHLTFPTLGQVYIGDNNEVQHIYGGRDSPRLIHFGPRPKPDPPNPELIGEEELRELLRTIDRAPHLMSGPKPYRALDMIQIVNALQPLGKEKALAVIDEYLRVCSEFHSSARTGSILILRLLFEVPVDPTVLPFSTGLWEREYRPQFPLYPLILYKDIPLFLFPLGGYSISGGMPQPWPHLKYYRKHGIIRKTPLRPTDDPLAIFDELLASPKWTFEKKNKGPVESEDEMARLILANQLLALVETVYDVEPDEFGQRIRLREDLKARWNKILGEFSQLEVHWDVGQQKYVFADGSSLPPRLTGMYRRQIWEIGVPVRQVRLIMERLNDEKVTLILDYHIPNEALPLPTFTVRVFDPWNPEITIESLPLSKSIRGAGRRTERVDLAMGGSLQAEVIIDGKVAQTSPIYKP